MITSQFKHSMLLNINNFYSTHKSFFSIISLNILGILMLSMFFMFSVESVSATEFPNAELLSPEENSVYNSSILIEWIASDPQGLDLEVFLYYRQENTNNWVQIVNGPVNNTGSYLWDCTHMSDGHYSILISVSNEDGYGDGDETGIFTIDNDNSPLKISELKIFDTNNKLKTIISNNENIVLKATIQHGDHITKDEIWADLHQIGNGKRVNPDSFDGLQAIWNISLIQCNPENGLISIELSVDNLETASLIVVADNSPPKITISYPNKGFYFYNTRLLPIGNLIVFGFIDIDFLIEENEEIKEINFYIDGKLDKTLYSSPYSFQITTPLFGFHKLSVQAIDGAGFSDKSSITGFFFIF